jgi:hypothetical protein
MVLNFLRLDTLIKPGNANLVERISRFIEEPRKSKFKHLSADEWVEKFNWSDLVRVCEKEWGLFQAMFGDKNDFSAHGRVLNERYDAHAKDADRLKIALYRKSLDYFEERMARV